MKYQRNDPTMPGTPEEKQWLDEAPDSVTGIEIDDDGECWVVATLVLD